MLRVGLTGGLGSGKSAVAAVFAEGGAHVFSADEIGRALMQPGERVYTQIVEHFGREVVAASGQLDRQALARQAFEGGRLAELNAIIHPAVLRAQTQLLDKVEANDPGGIAVIESALIFEVSGEVSGEASGETSQPLSGELTRASEDNPGDDPENSPENTNGREPNRTAPAPASPRSLNWRSPGHWRSRFDRLVLVTAPDELKIARYVSRVAPPGATPATREQLAADARSRLAAQIPDAEKIPFCDFVIENTQSLVLLRRRAQAVLAALRQG